MPLYIFKCKNTKCNQLEFEEMVSIEKMENNKVICPKCGKKVKVEITNPLHYKHLSWSKWRAI